MFFKFIFVSQSGPKSPTFSLKKDQAILLTPRWCHFGGIIKSLRGIGLMVEKEIIELLDLKNNALEDFAMQNDLFLKLAQKRNTSLNEFKIFYKRREEILQKINKIDILMERMCSFREMDFVTEDSRQQVKTRQKVKKQLVTTIIEQDLEIMTFYAESNAFTIE